MARVFVTDWRVPHHWETTDVQQTIVTRVEPINGTVYISIFSSPWRKRTRASVTSGEEPRHLTRKFHNQSIQRLVRYNRRRTNWEIRRYPQTEQRREFTVKVDIACTGYVASHENDHKPKRFSELTTTLTCQGNCRAVSENITEWSVKVDFQTQFGFSPPE